MQIVSLRDVLQKLSNPIFLKNKKHKFVICWIDPESNKD